LSTSVGGALLGHGCNFAIGDDLHNALQSESGIEREKTVDFWDAVITRLNDAERDCRLLMQQRTHEMDAAGKQISDGAEHLVLPAEYDPHHPLVSIHDMRTVAGEPLWPERYPTHKIQEIRKVLGAYKSSSYLDQWPTPKKGGIFNKDSFQIVKKSAIPEGLVYIRSWDLAASEKGDWTVGVKSGLDLKNKLIYILDVDRFRSSPGKTKNLIRKVVIEDGMDVRRQSFPQDPGQAGKTQRHDYVRFLSPYPVRFSMETGSKETRADSFAARVENGDVFLVEGDWNDAYISELCSFPNGTYDDQVDASSRCYMEYQKLDYFNTKCAAPIGIRAIRDFEMEKKQNRQGADTLHIQNKQQKSRFASPIFGR